MGRVVVTAVAVAALVAGIFYYESRDRQLVLLADQKQIADLQQQIVALKKENEQLKTNLDKVQTEQANLAAQNEALNKAIGTYKSTGKMPDLGEVNKMMKLPYPPK
jgi:septal ring factor EnvC (AmiA/AmiB activator)